MLAPQNSLEELFGPTLHLNGATLELSFPTAFQRLHISFYRSKLTSWMAAQEEDYRCGACPLFRLGCHACLMGFTVNPCVTQRRSAVALLRVRDALCLFIPFATGSISSSPVQ